MMIIQFNSSHKIQSINAKMQLKKKKKKVNNRAQHLRIGGADEDDVAIGGDEDTDQGTQARCIDSVVVGDHDRRFLIGAIFHCAGDQKTVKQSSALKNRRY